MSSDTIASARGIEFLAWLEVNKKRLVAGGLVVGLLVSGLAIYRWRSAQQEIEAFSALVQAQMRRATSGESNAAGRADAMLEFVSEYGGTRAGRRGVLLAAGALFQEGKFEESLAHFERFRSENSGDPLVDTAAFGVAKCLEAMAKPEEAMAAHREVIATYPEGAAVSQSRLALAGLLEEKGDPQQALTYLDQLRTTAWANEAESRRQALLAKYPELTPTNSSVPELSLPGMEIPENGVDD